MNDNLLTQYLPQTATRSEFLAATTTLVRPTDEELSASPQERLRILHSSNAVRTAVFTDPLSVAPTPHFPRPQLYPVYIAIDAYMRSGYALRAKEQFHDGQPVIGARLGKEVVDTFKRRLASVEIMSDEKTILLTGPSGGGKSVGLEKICTLFPAFIDHVTKTEGEVQLIQIPILRVRCIGRFTAKDVAMSFFNAIARIVGPSYTAHYRHSRSVDYLFAGIATLCNTFAVGLVIWDEFQDILQAKGTDSRSILNLILATISLSKTPMLFCGTYHTLDIFSEDVRASRRYAQADFRIHRVVSPESSEWKTCCRIRWAYQFVKNQSEITPEIIALLHEYTQGLPAYLDTIMVNCQIEAIMNGSEIINADNLKRAWIKSTALHGPVAALTSGNVSALENYRDLWHPELTVDPLDLLEAAKRAAKANQHVIR